MKISTLLYEKSCVDEASLSLALQIARENILTELRDSGLLEEKPVNICGFNFKGVTVETEAAVEIIFAYEKIGHNALAGAIKAHINNLINPVK